MLRFIDLRGQGTGYSFAWFDTRTDTFLNYVGNMVWDNWENFQETFLFANSSTKVENLTQEKQQLLQRFKSLCPEWVFKEIDIESVYIVPLGWISFDTLLGKANAMCNKYEIMHDDIFVKTTPEGGIVLDKIEYVYKDNSGAD